MPNERSSAPESATRSASATADAELVASAVAGDRQARRALVDRHQAKVYRLALRITRNESDAQDVLQETFLNVFRKLGSFQGASAFSTWLYRVTVNTALMKLRSSRRAEEISLDDVLPLFSEDGEIASAVTDWSDRADRLLENKELGAVIRTAVDGLPDKYRVVFLLRDVEELSTEEVAEVLELSVPAVKTRLHRARLYLRQAISRSLDGEPGRAGSPASVGGDA